MLAAFYTRQGPAREVLQVGEQPTPLPGSGEIRVRLRTSGVNPSDWKSRGGTRGASMVAPLIIPHSDGAGDIDAVGPGVPDRVGERVWIWNAQYRRAYGTAAEFAVLPSAQAVHLPTRVSYAEGACLGVPAFTALQAVRLGAITAGMHVFVAGGAGSVGHYAIQLAKRRGAFVVTTVSGGGKAEHARSAGADKVINYRTEDVGAQIKSLTGGQGVDLIIDLDLAANGKAYPLILRPHGTAVIYGMTGNEATLPTLWLMQNSITLKLFRIYDISPKDRSAGIAEIGALLEASDLTHTIARRLPLHDIAYAHELGEASALIGNIVLDIA
jgi:NADPH:quinone reductase